MPLSTALIHDGSGGTFGTYSQVQAQNAHYQHKVEVANNWIINNTNIDKKTMKVVGIINGLKSVQGHGIPYGCPIQEAIKLVEGGESNE